MGDRRPGQALGHLTSPPPRALGLVCHTGNLAVAAKPSLSV